MNDLNQTRKWSREEIREVFAYARKLRAIELRIEAEDLLQISSERNYQDRLDDLIDLQKVLVNIPVTLPK